MVQFKLLTVVHMLRFSSCPNLMPCLDMFSLLRFGEEEEEDTVNSFFFQ